MERIHLSTHYVEARMEERGVEVDHATVHRWVIQDSPHLEEALHRRQRPGWVRWRLDAPSINVQGAWRSLSRAGETPGQTLDWLLTAHRAQEAARRLLQQAIRRHGGPKTSTMDGSDAREGASKRANEAPGTPLRIRQVTSLPHRGEQDHRGVQRVTRPRRGLQSCAAAQDPLVGSVRMPRIKQRQREVQEGDKGLTTAALCDALAASSPLQTGPPAPA